MEIKSEFMIMQKLKALDQRMNALEILLTKLAGSIPERTLSEAQIQETKERILRQISTHWTANQLPFERRVLGQIFGKRCAPMGGVDFFIKALLADKSIQEITKLTGTGMFLPYEAWQNLSQRELQTFREFGVSSARVSKIQKVQVRSEEAAKHKGINPEDEDAFEAAARESEAEARKLFGIPDDSEAEPKAKGE